MHHRFCVGLTGGVGSGKSTVARLLAELGAAIVDTDVIAHALTGPGGAAMPMIRARFDAGVIAPDGALDRSAMRTRVFADVSARKTLEEILHPLIRSESLRLGEAIPGPYIVLVVPLLREHLPEYRPLLDRIAVVDCDTHQQVQRTATRPGVDEAQARAIMDAQAGRAERLAIADDVIENRSDQASLKAAVVRLHAHYLTLARGKSTNKCNYPLH